MPGRISCAITLVLIVVLGCANPPERQAVNQLYNDWSPGDQAQAAQTKSISEPQIMPVTFFTAGQLFQEQGRYREAIMQYRRAIELNRDFIAAYTRLAICLNQLGRYHQADETLRQALQRKPQAAFLHNNLAFSLMLQRRWNEAEEELKLALQLQPDYDRARTNLGLSLSKQGRYAEAFEQFQATVGDSRAHYNMGMLYKAQGKHVRAAEAFRQAFTLEPRMIQAKIQLDKLEPLLSDTATIGTEEFAQAPEPDQNLETPVAQTDPLVTLQADQTTNSTEQYSVFASAATSSEPLLKTPLIPEQEPCEMEFVDRLLEDLLREMQPCHEDEFIEQFVFRPSLSKVNITLDANLTIRLLDTKVREFLEKFLSSALLESTAIWHYYQAWSSRTLHEANFLATRKQLQLVIHSNWNRVWKQVAEAKLSPDEAECLLEVSFEARQGLDSLLASVTAISLAELQKYDFDSRSLDEFPQLTIPFADSYQPPE